MLDKTMQGLRKITLNVSAVAVILMAVMEIIEIISRSFFNHSFLIVDEFAGYLMACMTFTGLANSYGIGTFVRVEAIYGLIKGSAKRVLNVAYSVILLIFSCVFTYYSVLLNYNSFAKHLVSTGFYRTPIAYPQLTMSFGLICFCLYVLLDIVRQIRDFRKEDTAV